MVCSFACFDLHGLILYARVNNLSVLSGWVYLSGSSNKQPVKYLFALIFFIPVGSGRFLIPLFYTRSVPCSRTQHSDSDVCESRTRKNLQLSHCAPHRHERLRQTLSIITLILLDSLLLINKKRHVDINYLHVLILKRNVSFRRFF